MFETLGAFVVWHTCKPMNARRRPPAGKAPVCPCTNEHQEYADALIARVQTNHGAFAGALQQPPIPAACCCGRQQNAVLDFQSPRAADQYGFCTHNHCGRHQHWNGHLTKLKLASDTWSHTPKCERMYIQDHHVCVRCQTSHHALMILHTRSSHAHHQRHSHLESTPTAHFPAPIWRCWIWILRQPRLPRCA